MMWIEETYGQLIQDATLYAPNGGSRVSRKRKLTNEIDIVLSIVRYEKTREFCVRIKDKPQSVAFPQWCGVGISIQKIVEYGESEAVYLVLSQSQNTRPEIFEYMAEDIAQRIAHLNKLADCLPCLQQALAEWKRFFDKEQDNLLNPDRIQGLFGELLFLQELLGMKGPSAISSWAGCSGEQHDFYIGNNAIEVKTTVSKAPYIVEISSEYQLDPVDVDGLLFLRVYPLRKSESGGKTLSALVDEIIESLEEAPYPKSMFLSKLEMSGYRLQRRDLYDRIGFKVRETLTYEVPESFPAVRRSQLPTGISKIRYSLNTEVCYPYERSVRLIEILTGDEINAGR